MTKFESILKQFGKAVEQLDDVLKQKKSEYMRDSAIQRFEFTFELSWKLIKAFLEEEKGITCRSPKDCFKDGFQQGIIEYDDFWIKITDLRNTIAHIYEEAAAEDIYNQLPKILNYFRELLKNIKNY